MNMKKPTKKTKEYWKEQLLDFLERNEGQKFLITDIFSNIESHPIRHTLEELKEAVEELKVENKIDISKDKEGSELLSHKD